MIDYAPNFTPRFKLRYSVQGLTHTVTVRGIRGSRVEAAVLGAKLAHLLDMAAAVRYTDWLALGAEFADEDSDIFLPVTVPTIIAGTAATGLRPASHAITQYTVPGRTTGGARSMLYLYGLAFSAGDDLAGDNYRIHAAENSDVAAMLSSLSEVAPGFAGSDGNLAMWKPYVNVKQNSHWTYDQRS